MMNRNILKDLYWKKGEGRAYSAEEIEDMDQDINEYIDLYEASDEELIAYCEDASGWDYDCVPDIIYDLAERNNIEIAEGDDAEVVLRKIKMATNRFAADAKEIVKNGQYNVAVNLMDDDLREEIHAEMTPCTDEEFLAEYMSRHYAKYGEEFTV